MTYTWNINGHDKDNHERKVPRHKCGECNQNVVLLPAAIVKMNESSKAENQYDVDRQ